MGIPEVGAAGAMPSRPMPVTTLRININAARDQARGSNPAALATDAALNPTVAALSFRPDTYIQGLAQEAVAAALHRHSDRDRTQPNPERSQPINVTMTFNQNGSISDVTVTRGDGSPMPIHMQTALVRELSSNLMGVRRMPYHPQGPGVHTTPASGTGPLSVVVHFPQEGSQGRGQVR